MADGRVVRVEKCVQIQITIGNCQFTEEFLILQNMTSMLLGLPFFRKYNIVIHPYKGLLYLPDLTISLASPIKNKKTLEIANFTHSLENNDTSKSTGNY